MIVLKWAWVYGSLHVEEFDSLDEAVRSAVYAAEAGDESLDYIEVIDDDGTSTRHERDSAVVRAVEEQQHEMDRAAYEAAPAVTHRIRAANADGKEATISSFTDRGKAALELERLRPLLGGRVWIEWYDKLERSTVFGWKRITQ